MTDDPSGKGAPAHGPLAGLSFCRCGAKWPCVAFGISGPLATPQPLPRARCPHGNIMLDGQGVFPCPRCDDAAEIARLRTELEREQLRLAACSVMAMADTPEKAVHARCAIPPEHQSASCDDVARRVDECIQLRTQLATVTAERDEARALNTINVCAYCCVQFPRTTEGQVQLTAHVVSCAQSPLVQAIHRLTAERDAARSTADTSGLRQRHDNLCRDFADVVKQKHALRDAARALVEAGQALRDHYINLADFGLITGCQDALREPAIVAMMAALARVRALIADTP